MPKYPERVGIVTSPTGAAIRDMINVSHRRFPLADIVIYPAEVQGTEAPARLIEGIEFFNSEKNADVIIIGRGGGSLEDLWAFNNEKLARSVFASEIPVISAVGHETDFTICDFVSDRRAPTPSAAAEIALPDMITLNSELYAKSSLLGRLLTERVERSREKLLRLSDSYALKSPDSILAKYRISLDRSCEKLDTAIDRRQSKSSHKLKELSARMSGLNPLSVLARGYTAVSDLENNGVVTGACMLSADQKVKLRFADGEAQAKILKIEVYNGKEDKI